MQALEKAQELLTSLRGMSALPSDGFLPSLLIGALTYSTLLRMGQGCLKILKVPTRLHAANDVLGLALVSGSSLGAATVSICTWQGLMGKPIVLLDPLESTATACSGALLFRFQGGRGRFVVPANLFREGPFAVHSLPATVESYATPAEKQMLERWGSQFGCHHCGSKSGPFIGDHIPPTKLVMENIMKGPQRFLPQCQPCSSKQSVAVKTRTSTYVIPSMLTANWYHVHISLPLVWYSFPHYFPPRPRNTK